MTGGPLGQFGKLLRFSITHSVRDMGRNRARTAFALVCVATGVAAVVALRTLAFMVGDALTSNLAEVNRGDIRVYASTGVPDLIELTNRRLPVFSAETVQLFRDWAAREHVQITVARLSESAQIQEVRADGAGDSLAVMTLFVEPGKYPFYDTITLQNPAGATLASAFTGGAEGGDQPHPMVIASGLADAGDGLGLAVGDLVKLGGSDTLFVVSGVAEDQAETLLTLPQTVFLDYVYLPMSDLPLIGEQPLPDQVFFKVPIGRDVAAVQQSMTDYLQAHTDTTVDIGEQLNVASVPELEKQNAEAADVIDDLILVMGLSSLLIGGIGIINTMLVVVSRRTLEIAVLKTLGLKAKRVTFLFLMEALLMGVLGSLIGMVLGVVLSYAIRGVGERAFSIVLTWRLYPEALLSGLFLGVLVTGLFGFLPTLIAGQVRPAIVLRPNEAQMPAAGLLQTLLTLVVMIVFLGLLVNTIIVDALHIGPLAMFIGGGALVGLFAGIIISNTRLGKPIPEYYEFRLARRYERLETWLIRAAGGARRGRANIMLGLRASRQAALAYGAAAVGALAASFVLLLVSEVWLPFGIGQSKPAGNIVDALQVGAWGWVAAWLALTLALGLLVRFKGRALVGLIALGSLGITAGGLAGWALSAVLKALLGDSVIWAALDDVSTGIVLTEGALALLGVIYALYWLLVWASGKLPVFVMTGVISAIILTLVIGSAAVVSLLGTVALALYVAAALAAWLLLRRLPRRDGGEGRPAGGAPATLPASVLPSASGLMLALAGMGGSVLVFDLAGAGAVRGALLAGAVLLVVLWWYLRRRHSVDARLILREMAGRRTRVASTLLGLSVGIAGLSIVSLSTGAASRLLQVQLGESTEGNLLVIAWNQAQGVGVRDALSAVDGVQKVSQLTTYVGQLLQINGEDVQRFHDRAGDNMEARENGNFERPDEGFTLMLSERADLATMPDYEMKEGRNLGPEDDGQHRVLMRDSFFVEEFGIHAGDQLMFQFDNGLSARDDVTLMLRVVGIVSRQSERNGLEDAGGLLIVPPHTLSDEGVRPQNVISVVLVDENVPGAMRRAKTAATNVRGGVLAVEIGALTQFLENLLDQLKAIPTLVAWLALMAGTAIIANTVALATQERRREIGVMKAVGLKGWRVLGMLMLENGLIGMLAGLIGAGAGFLVTVIIVLTSQNPSELKTAIDFGTMGWLVLMSIAVAMAAATLSAWSAAAEKPMNVLRYE